MNRTDWLTLLTAILIVSGVLMSVSTTWLSLPVLVRRTFGGAYNVPLVSGILLAVVTMYLLMRPYEGDVPFVFIEPGPDKDESVIEKKMSELIGA